jgi:hypothetical protein
MRLAAALALALCVAAPAANAANATERVQAVHKPHGHAHRVLHASPHPVAAPAASPFAFFFGAPPPPSSASRSMFDKCYDGLSRDPDCCNYGCIDNSHSR